MPLFHATQTKLSSGKIIRPGNWGRIIRRRGKQHPHWESEEVFERVRAERFPHLPSRLTACFACPTEAGLRLFVQQAFRDNKRAHYLYEVEKVDAGAPQHSGDYNLIRVLKQGETLEGQAQRYWQGNFWYNIAEHPGMRCEEVVTPSPLRILRELI